MDIVLIAALAYAFLNGLHDAPSVLAQVVSTRSMGPRRALLWIAGLEFLGAFFLSGAVLKTMSFADLRATLEAAPVEELKIFVLAALAASFVFNAVTWFMGIPSSSSHALFGAMAGAALALGLANEALLERLGLLIAILMASAVLATLAAWAVTRALYSLDVSFAAGSTTFPAFNTLSSGALALFHGANDMPKSLGLFLLAQRKWDGSPEELRPYLLLFAAAIALGMLFGENRILKTLSLKLFRLRVVQGAGANAAACATLGACTFWGLPVSFTQLLVGSLAGSGAASPAQRLRWEVVFEILLSWLVTLPASAALGFFAAKLLAA